MLRYWNGGHKTNQKKIHATKIQKFKSFYGWSKLAKFMYANEKSLRRIGKIPKTMNSSQ